MTPSPGGAPSAARPTVSDRSRPRLRAVSAGVVAGFGAAFLVQRVAAAGWSSTLQGALELPYLLLALSLVYGGYWLLRCDFHPQRVGRIALWSVLGLVGLVGVAVWLVPVGSTSIQESLQLAIDVGTVGASAGLLVGLEGGRRYGRSEHDGVDPRLAAERAEARLEFVNRLLRHHLLNGVAVVRGNAELLVDTRSDPPTEAQVIRERCDELADLVANIGTLSRAYARDLPARSIDLRPPLLAAAESVRRDRTAADVRTDLRPVGGVLANGRIETAFEVLLRVAVDSAEDGRVALSTERTADAVLVDFTFDGPPHGRVGARADPWADEADDLGLFLAESLLEYFGGDVTPTDTGFTVRLQPAD